MNSHGLVGIAFAVAWSLGAAPLPPEGTFRLKMEEVVETSHCRVVVLKIETRSTAEMIQVRFAEGGSEGRSALSGTPKSKTRHGEIVLTALRTHSESPINTSVVLQPGGGGSSASLSASHDLPPDAKVETTFSLVITNGSYPLNRPLLIGTRNNEPMRLVVGRWNSDQARK